MYNDSISQSAVVNFFFYSSITGKQPGACASGTMTTINRTVRSDNSFDICVKGELNGVTHNIGHISIEIFFIVIIARRQGAG